MTFPKKAIIWLIALLVTPLFVAVSVAVAVFSRTTRDARKPPRLVWGPEPIISNSYWSRALAEGGLSSKTLVYPYYPSINERGDYDLYVFDIVRWPLLNKPFTRLLNPYISFVYALANFDVFHHPYTGGFLGRTPLWRLEAPLLGLAGKRVVILPYGGDFYRYSRVVDPSLRHGLLLSYPSAAREEGRVEARVSYWTRRADAVVAGFQGVDGLGRWDALPFIPFTIDMRRWGPKVRYSPHDGASGVVRVMHTPNHRGFKGTEFLLRAVEELREEGLKVELLLVEGRPNEEVRHLMNEEADVLAEQFVATGYAMSAIEGMASGLPVMANLEHEAYTRLFRRYSYLNECPILSTTPETLKGNLRALVADPELREELGRAGRLYAEKYHSGETARYMFGAIYEKVWFGREEADLLNLFHPLKSEYNRRGPLVEHPLVENRLPEDGGKLPAGDPPKR